MNVNDNDREFRPDWYSPTGDTVREWMRLKGVSREHLSCCLGEADNGFIDALLSGTAAVSPGTAVALASALGGTADFWLRRDARYWADKARIDAERGSGQCNGEYDT